MSTASLGKRLAAIAVSIGTACLLGACASLQPPEPPPAAPGVELTRWSGRFSATYAQPGETDGENRASGRFRLERLASHTVLELSGPLGQTIASAQVDDRGARLTDSNGRTYQAASAEALTERLFGWRVPVLALPGWLQGRIRTPVDAEAGKVWTGTDSGWSIRIESWIDTGRARVLELVWPIAGTPSDRRLRLRLVVDTAS